MSIEEFPDSQPKASLRLTKGLSQGNTLRSLAQKRRIPQVHQAGIVWDVRS
jgi:hypothetical protein